MSTIYPLIKVLSGKKNPNLKETKGMDPKKSMQYLLEDGNMKGKYLGACLDSCRWGSINTVMWETSISGLMNFISKWRDENNDDSRLYHEMPLGDLYSRFELPHINHEHCPRISSHRGTFIDSIGRIRCSHRTVNKMKPSFIEEYEIYDELSQMKTKYLYEEVPHDPTNFDEKGNDITIPEEYESYLDEISKYNSEKSEEVVDVCYSIISDNGIILPFETILTRLNLAPLEETVYCYGPFDICRRTDEFDSIDKMIYDATRNCPGHTQPCGKVVFPFDGWDLAYYLQKWKEQDNGKAPWFSEKKEKWTPKIFPCYD